MDIITLVNVLPECEVFGHLDLEIKNITDNSQEVKRDSLFVAIKGLHVDAYKLIPQAIRSGAVAVVGEQSPNQKMLEKVVYIKVPNARQALGYLASRWYGDPSQKLKVIGITGTDGKTTTANLLWQMLNDSGKKAGLVSTIGARIGNKVYDTGLHVTNPEALELQKHLALMVKDGCKYAVLEVTSHGIDQGRVAGVQFDTTVLTNITHEHLDYHKNIKNYKETKAKLFENMHHAVLNKDDKEYQYFCKIARGSKIHSYSYNSDYVEDSPLPGRYNLYNLSAAVTVARIYRCPDSKIRRALRNFPVLPGRMEEVRMGQKFKVFVDFAHTPNSLKSVLVDLRILLPKSKKLIALFGCAGERDTSTRAMRGKIVALYAHKVIVTADDPRREKLENIYKDIVSGVSKKLMPRVIRIDDRRRAIAKALSLAEEGDTIVFAGKGHEKSINIRGKELPWSDVEVVRELLKT